MEYSLYHLLQKDRDLQEIILEGKFIFGCRGRTLGPAATSSGTELDELLETTLSSCTSSVSDVSLSHLGGIVFQKIE